MIHNPRSGRSGFGLAPWFLAALLASGCVALGPPGQALVPSRHQTRTGPFVVFTDFPTTAQAPAIRQLQALDHQLEATLGLRVDPATAPIEVYILNDRRAFTHFLTDHHPEFPPRRAFFLAQGSRRVVYTYLGDRLDEDLRHEATHALLHATIGPVPLWLDEGLAEYFEGTDGVNPEHLARLPEDEAEGWEPDLARLEALADVRQMSPRDYREAWAWAHYCLEGPPAGKAILLGYLRDLRETTDPVPLSRRLGPESGASDRLQTHLERLRERPLVASSPPREPTVRLQSAPSSVPIRVPSRRGGLLGRIRDAIGL